MRKFFAKPWVMWVGVGIGVAILLARFLLVNANLIGHPDPGYFWGGAEELLRTGHLTDYYYAVFPYMTGYIGALAGLFGWLGVGVGSVIALNMIFELIGIAALFFLVRGVTGSWRKGVWASVIWCLNPFHFIFSGLAMPIVAFDSLLIACCLVGWLLWRSRQRLVRFLVLSASMGLAIAVAGWFRPTTSVFLIALALFFGWGLIRDRFKGWWKILLSLVIVAGVFMGATKLEMKYAEYVTGATGLDNYAGWSVYVGSSEVNGGSWNEADAKVFWDDYLLNGYTIAEANSEVMKLGIDRYVERGIVGNIGFLGIKAARFALKTPTSIYYFAQSWGWSAWLIYAWGWLFTLVCWAGLIVGLVRGWRGMLKGGFLLLLVLVVLGMFASGLLVEVMDRYFIPVLAVMFLVGACYAQKASQ